MPVHRPRRRPGTKSTLGVITTNQDIRPPNTGTTPIQRRRLWANTVPTLGERFVSAGKIISYTYIQKVPAYWRYGDNALNQNWVNVGPLSVTLANTQRDVKHDTVTRYWATVGSAS